MGKPSDRRKEYRLPFGQKAILTDGKKSITAYADNVSRGGMFVLSLETFSIETPVRVNFLLPNQPGSLCLKGRVAHIVMDKERCEIDCGMGIEYMDLTDSQKTILNVHMANQKSSYLELRRMLSLERPDMAEVNRYLERLPTLQNLDLLSMRYRVDRVCTLFESHSGTTRMIA